MHKLKNYILCVLISILLFFSAAAAQGVLFIKYTVLDPETYYSIMDQNGVYEKVYSELDKHFQSEENATGIPANVYMDAITQESVKNIVNDSVSNAFGFINGNSNSLDDKLYESELVPLKNSVDKFFEEYAASINYKKDDAYYEKTASVFKSASDYIIETADVYQFKTIEKAGYLSYAKTAAKYADIGTAAAIALNAVLILILIISNIKHISNCLYWLSISAGSVSVVFLSLCIYLKVTNYFDQFAIKAQHIFTAMTGAFSLFTDRLTAVNVIILAVSILFMIFFAFAGKEKINNK